MQTFVPYSDVRAAVAALDLSRLGKQRVETLQILRALTWATYGWRNHPAVRMWRGFTPALVAYGLATCDEWIARGRADAVRPTLLTFTDGVEPDLARLRAEGELPPWFGREDVHASHRSALLRKAPEHYRSLFGDEPDDVPYVWPAPVFPLAPVWRAQEQALDLPAALAALGVEAVTPAQAAVVRDVRAGASARLTGTRAEGTLDGALLAGLCTPGRTLWMVPGPSAEPPGPPPAAYTGEVLTTTVSPSVAREPSPEDERSVRAEAAASRKFRFLHGDQTIAPEVAAGVGLVIQEPGTTVPAGAEAPVLELVCDVGAAG